MGQWDHGTMGQWGDHGLRAPGVPSGPRSPGVLGPQGSQVPVGVQKHLNIYAPRDGTAAGRHGGAAREH